MWVMGILLVINLFNGFLFAVEPDGTYHRGPGFILTYIIPYTYVFVAFLRAHHQLIDKSFTGDRHSLRLITLFPIAPGIAGVFQFFPENAFCVRSHGSYYVDPLSELD